MVALLSNNVVVELVGGLEPGERANISSGLGVDEGVFALLVDVSILISDNQVTHGSEFAIAVVVGMEIEINELFDLGIIEGDKRRSIAEFLLRGHVDDATEAVVLQVLLDEAESKSNHSIVTNLYLIFNQLSSVEYYLGVGKPDGLAVRLIEALFNDLLERFNPSELLDVVDVNEYRVTGSGRRLPDDVGRAHGGRITLKHVFIIISFLGHLIVTQLEAILLEEVKELLVGEESSISSAVFHVNVSSGQTSDRNGNLIVACDLDNHCQSVVAHDVFDCAKEVVGISFAVNLFLEGVGSKTNRLRTLSSMAKSIFLQSLCPSKEASKVALTLRAPSCSKVLSSKMSRSGPMAV